MCVCDKTFKDWPLKGPRSYWNESTVYNVTYHDYSKFFSSKKNILCMYCICYITAGQCVYSLARQSRKDSDLKVHSVHAVLPTFFRFFFFLKFVCTANVTLAFNTYFEKILCQNEMTFEKWTLPSMKVVLFVSNSILNFSTFK